MPKKNAQTQFSEFEELVVKTFGLIMKKLEKIDVIEADIKDIQDDVKFIQNDIKQIKVDLGSTQNDVGNIKSDIREMRKELRDTTMVVIRIEHTIADLDDRVLKLEMAK